MVAPVALTFDVLPSMLEKVGATLVNVSSGVSGPTPDDGGTNAYVTTKAALEGHTLNLAAELAGSGVSVNVYRPGGVDTSMQGFVRGQGPDQGRCRDACTLVQNYEGGSLITADESAAGLSGRLSIAGEETGQIWDVRDA